MRGGVLEKNLSLTLILQTKNKTPNVLSFIQIFLEMHYAKKFLASRTECLYIHILKRIKYEVFYKLKKAERCGESLQSPR